MQDEEFELLKEELLWNGSKVAALDSNEQRFLEAQRAFASVGGRRARRAWGGSTPPDLGTCAPLTSTLVRQRAQFWPFNARPGLRVAIGARCVSRRTFARQTSYQNGGCHCLHAQPRRIFRAQRCLLLSLQGKPIMNDEEFDQLKGTLRNSNSIVVAQGPRCRCAGVRQRAARQPGDLPPAIFFDGKQQNSAMACIERRQFFLVGRRSKILKNFMANGDSQPSFLLVAGRERGLPYRPCP